MWLYTVSMCVQVYAFESFNSVGVLKIIFVKDSLFNLNELFVQSDLSYTLQRISKYGYKEFYIGKTADNIIISPPINIFKDNDSFNQRQAIIMA